MDHNNNQFDEAALFKRKDRHCGYQYCPLCGNELSERDLDGKPRMACRDRSCGFVFYQNPLPAAGALLVRDNEILLVKRAHPPRIGYWCIPAGFMEWHEHPRQTAVREVREETGLEIELTELFDIYSGNDDPRANALLILYLADVVGGEMRAADDALDVAYFPLDHIPNQIAFEAHLQAFADLKQWLAR